MSTIEKMKQYIDRTKLNTDKYSIDADEVFFLTKEIYTSSDLALDVVFLAFNYGKAKGYRMAKAEKKGKVDNRNNTLSKQKAVSSPKEATLHGMEVALL